MARVEHVFLALVHRFPMKEVLEARAEVEKGLEGCIHGRTGTPRQVLVMDIETLEEFRLEPGSVKENITTRGLLVRALAKGQRLQVGEALLEVAAPCEPCHRMENIRAGLKVELRGRRGILCRVVKGGRIRRGDAISVGELVEAGE